MSHFPVIVIGDDIEKQLAPYQENNCDTCPKEFLSFFDTEDEYRREYEEGSTVMLKSPEGELFYSWDQRFQEGDFLERKTVIPPGYVEITVAHKDRYASFDEFVEDWHEASRDAETGRYGYWENPNKKWDWYQIGGRWSGYFKLKNGGAPISGGRRGYADQALKRNVDFEGMKEQAGNEAGELWDKVHAAIDEHMAAFQSWAEIRDMHKDEIKAARTAYLAQPAVQAFHEHCGPISSHVDDFMIDRDTYIEQARNSAIATHAVLKDGKWYQRGQMGWWAIVIDEKNPDAWSKEFAALMDSLPDDTMLTAVDCHI